MKKIVVSIFVLIIAFSMCACEGVTRLGNVELPPLPDVSATEEPAVETAEPEVTVVAPTRTSVYFNHVQEENYDPASGEKLILSFSYDALSVHMEGRDAATAIINEYIATVDETYYTGNDYGTGSSIGKSKLLELAEDNFRVAYENNALDMNLEYTSARTGAVTRADGNVLSIRYTDNVYTGGEHGSYGYEAYVFDSESGQRLTLDMLSSDPDGLKSFLTQYMVDAAAQADISSLIDTTLVPEEQKAEKLSALLRDGSWYFDADGLVIFPQLNEISAYDVGIVEFKIPYSDLKNVVDTKWIPGERTDSGSLSVNAFEDIEDGSMEIADMVTIDADGRQVCIISEGTLYDVRLSGVEYSDKFYETQRIWYCNELTDCGVQLVLSIPEGMPNVMISYRSADGTVTNRLISESGLDGSIVLVDDNIEAVG